MRVRAHCRDGKTERITVENLPSFAVKLSAQLEVEGIGTLTVDTAFGGDSFVIVDASALGIEVREDEAGEMARLGVRITKAANQQLGFEHPENPDWRHISFCHFAGALTQTDNGFAARSTVSIQPGKIDRSPCGTAVSARMAVLAARGRMTVGQTLNATSAIGSKFTGRIERTAVIGGKPAIVPSITGRAWITGMHQHMLDPSDPWPDGYKLGGHVGSGSDLTLAR